jgi:hypothetical protein
MGRRGASVALGLLLSAAAFAGCGDDAESDSHSDSGTRDAETAKHRDAGGDRDKDAATRGGSGGRDAAVGGKGGRDAAMNEAREPEATRVECGASICEFSENTFGRPCCADEAASTCGTSILGGACMPIDDTKCPDINFPGLPLPACCTSRGMCGIDTSKAGGPGCLDLATAAQRAREAGATVVFPAPRMCPADKPTDPTQPTDVDAGAEDAGL